ncbi:MAG TPA: aspartate-semialdehyde dehydrogenase, partial [Bacteroidales bacterium]|nr:aspartate-semialdehyde dehydrogenase [Bacteroidales bacterium]
MKKIAVVGASGMVGQAMLKVLEERNFPVGDLFPVASDKSAGREVIFKGEKYSILSITDAIEQKPDIAFFSAGSAVSLEWAPVMAKEGIIVIDNSSAWRMNKEVPLIVPEINASVLRKDHKIISNPNCSTIQLLMVIAPLHRVYGVKRLVISTYQSVTGTGKKAVEQMENEIKGIIGDMVYPHPIFMNCLPHCDSFLDNGYTLEEMKLVNETRKILNDNSIQVTATAVRLPVTGGHSESVNIEFKNDFQLADIREILGKAPGIILKDDPGSNSYPMPLDASGRDEVFAGRIRKDHSCERALNIWIVADNIRKGAATNAIQIAELFMKY